ncbi:MAG TPA: NAD(P)/FAD-dependent oxidoreductase, partial [Candidatus Limnocylindrales bacterium]|nr:NAD(P)/FAD-dependent oxidoreductase [Candidatus Limnocylindrales bacterium]
MTPSLDAIVVGAGPNGLAAAIELARAGRAVRIYEAADSVGGGVRSAALTLPGFVHDPCASVHPLSLASPAFRDLGLERHGLEWIHPDAPVAHAFAPGRSVVLPRDLDGDALEAALGRDADGWRRLFGALAREWERLVPMLLSPAIRVPRHPLLMARFGLPGVLPAQDLARLAFREPATRALFAGMAAHSMLPLHAPLSASFGLVLGLLAHAVGWPVAKGGSGAIAAALEAEARGLGVEIETGHRVDSLGDLPAARAYLLDVTPRQVLAIAGDRLPSGYRRQLEGFRYGPGVFKIDWALDGPIPWADPATARAATVHLGGTMREIAASEVAVGRGRIADVPFVLLVQPTIADPSRAPEGKHVAWAYCHVPNGSTEDMTAAIEAQVERFAPGFRDLVLARAVKDAPAMESYDANYVGGDINGGLADWRQLLFRPVVRWNPYTTPDPAIFLCSSSTPPGGGVHGMGGRHAAR